MSSAFELCHDRRGHEDDGVRAHKKHKSSRHERSGKRDKDKRSKSSKREKADKRRRSSSRASPVPAHDTHSPAVADPPAGGSHAQSLANGDGTEAAPGSSMAEAQQQPEPRLSFHQADAAVQISEGTAKAVPPAAAADDAEILQQADDFLKRLNHLPGSKSEAAPVQELGADFLSLE